MKFIVTRDYANTRSYGVGPFLDLWQVDALRALSECMMGDRDSDAGAYFLRLVDEEYINKQDLETACLEWLKTGNYNSPGSRDFMKTLELVLGLVGYFKLYSSLTWIIDNFDTLYRFVSSYRQGHFVRTLVNAVLRSNNVSKIWPQLREYFVTNDYCDSELFYALYILNAKLSAPGEMDSQLYRLAGLVRRTGSCGDVNHWYQRALGYMLMHKFGYHFRASQGEDVFEVAKAKSEKWWRSQSLMFKFPI